MKTLKGVTNTNSLASLVMLVEMCQSLLWSCGKRTELPLCKSLHAEGCQEQRRWSR